MKIITRQFLNELTSNPWCLLNSAGDVSELVSSTPAGRWRPHSMVILIMGTTLYEEGQLLDACSIHNS
jgi:hypothetical protein